MHQMHPHLMAESTLNSDTIKLQLEAYTGCAKAQYELANIFQKGVNIKKNEKYAFYWYQRAAEQGNLLAQYMVWLAYLLGDGTDSDAKQAKKWYTKASVSSSGSPESVVAQLLDSATAH